MSLSAVHWLQLILTWIVIVTLLQGVEELQEGRLGNPEC